MIHAALERPIPIELTDSPRIIGRVKRLAVTSAIALGLIWWLADSTLAIPIEVSLLLVAGWFLMPVTLAASVARPSLRYALVVPSASISIALLWICLHGLPAAPIVAAGWISTTVGVLTGGVLGSWFWYRVLPVPLALDDPESPLRWSLIAVHVALVVGGVALSAVGLIRG